MHRDQNTYTVKKVKSHSTMKPNPHTPKPTEAHHESRAFALSSSSIAACFSLIAVACHLVFVGQRRWIEATTTTVLFGLVLVSTLSSSTTSFVNASFESQNQLTIHVVLPENVQTLTIIQNNERKGEIEIVGDSSTPVSIKTFLVSTSANIELKDIAFSSCSRVSIQSQENILVDSFQAPTSGSCSISFKAGNQVVATLVDGYLGSFTLSCQQDTNKQHPKKTCYANAIGTAVKHSSSSLTISVNKTEGDTLCTGAPGYNMYISFLLPKMLSIGCTNNKFAVWWHLE